MKSFVVALFIALMIFAPAPAHARGYVAFGFGCCGGYYPYYSAPYYGYGYPAYYYAPPPTVVYAQPQTTYVVQQPAPQQGYAPQPGYTPQQAYAPAPQPQQAQGAPAPLSDPSASAPSSAPSPSAAPTAPVSQEATTFVDDKGRTCRKFQTMIDGSAVDGTACLQPDGSWRSVGE